MDKRFLSIFAGLVLVILGLLGWFKHRQPERVAPPAGGRTTGRLPPAKLRPFRGCSQDTDCVYAQNGCCDCANGAQEVAVNRGQLAAFQNHFACTTRPCTEIAASPACGTGVVRCKDSLCEFEGPER